MKTILTMRHLFLIDGIGLSKLIGITFLISLMSMMRTVIGARTRWTFYKEKGVQPTYWQEDENVNGLKHNNSLESEKQPFYECVDVSNCSRII